MNLAEMKVGFLDILDNGDLLEAFKSIWARMEKKLPASARKAITKDTKEAFKRAILKLWPLIHSADLLNQRGDEAVHVSLCSMLLIPFREDSSTFGSSLLRTSKRPSTAANTTSHPSRLTRSLTIQRRYLHNNVQFESPFTAKLHDELFIGLTEILRRICVLCFLRADSLDQSPLQQFLMT